jgi:hypothetical protein
MIVVRELSDSIASTLDVTTLERIGTNALTASVRDQAELQGVLRRVSDLCLTLLEVTTVGRDPDASGVFVHLGDRAIARLEPQPCVIPSTVRARSRDQLWQARQQ